MHLTLGGQFDLIERTKWQKLDHFCSSTSKSFRNKSGLIFASWALLIQEMGLHFGCNSKYFIRYDFRGETYYLSLPALKTKEVVMLTYLVKGLCDNLNHKYHHSMMSQQSLGPSSHNLCRIRYFLVVSSYTPPNM